MTLTDAIKQVGRFHRAPNYPAEESDVLEIAKDLIKAAPKGFEQARDIVSRCLELSSYVPTLHDMLTVAGELNPPPEPEPEPSWTPARTRCRFGRCDGHGWERRFFLVTLKGQGEFAYKEKTPITEAQYRDLSKKVDRQTQWVYDAATKCPCAAPTETRQLAAGDRDGN